MDAVPCCFCEQKFQSTVLLRDHIRKDHKYVKLSAVVADRYQCKIFNCSKKFDRSANFFRHINLCHLQSEKSNVVVKPHSIAEQPIEMPKCSTDADVSWTAEPLKLGAQMSEMIANLRFSTTMTGADLGRSVEATEELLSDVSKQIEEKVKKFLKYKGIDSSDKESKDFLASLEIKESFTKYKSMEGQIKAMKKHYSFIDAEEKLLGKDGAKEATFQYVSLIEILKLILSNKEVMDYLKSGGKLSDDEFIRCFEDGETFKEHDLFKKFVDAIGIHLYYDEFLVNNPLGSKTRQHKIGALYFSISNLPPHLRDWLGNVHVLAFGLHKDISKYGINQFLNPFFLELKLLETDSGVPVKINGEDYVLRAALLTLCADGLAAHEVLGFLGPSAKFFCRLCYMTSADRKECPEMIAPLRTRERHEKEAQASELNKDAQSASGVRHNTILNESRYFHCTKNYSFDEMHDMLEGQGPYDIKLSLAHMIDSKEYKLTAEILNHRIEKFRYGPEDIKDKPSATFTNAGIRNAETDHKIQERSAQTWCLLRIFPFLVADIVPPDDPYLNHIINLNKINEYIFSPKFKKSNLNQLRFMIYTHIENFCTLFPNANVINKLHHLTHYTLCMRKSGPMRHLACFKYEAKHQMFKKYGSICCNFKNIIKTMSNISQMSQCSVWGTQKNPLRKKLEENVTAEIGCDIGSDIKKAATDLSIELQEDTKLVNKISVYGIQYAVGSLVAIDGCSTNDDNLPTFGKIDRIIVSNNEVYLYCQEYVSMYLEEALNAYCVEEGEDFRLVNVMDLCDRKPFALWSDFSDDKLNYICLRHLIF